LHGKNTHMYATKEKFNIEYVFSTASKNSLWNCLSTPAGLSEWFADKVVMENGLFRFYWKNHVSEAELLQTVPYNSMRFHWLDEAPETYFEFCLHQTELTNDLTLEVIDFAEPSEQADAISLWDTQIKTLRRKLGI